ncbi:MAG: DUF4397 domain-containing protein [Burkholderiales bacterium]|nr:DUF4397 domain-containing protein [Burkholderiales bacterium]
MTSRLRTRRRLLATAALGTAAIASGCKINTINSFPSHPAKVRVMNLMPDAPAIDLAINGTAAFTNIAFENVSAYQEYENRTTSFAVMLSGSTTTLTSFSFPLAGDQPYTVVVYGALSAPQLTMVAEIGTAPNNGNIQVTVFHAAINAGGIDVYANPPGTDISNIAPSFAGVAYGGTTTALQLSPGAYQVRVTNQGNKTVIYDSGGSALTPNVALSFMAYSRGSGTLVNAQVLQANGPVTPLDTIFARVKAFNATPDVAQVNQFIGQLLVNGNVNFASASAYTQIPQGVTTVSFESSAVPGAPLAGLPATMTPATDRSAFIAGPAGNQQAFVLHDLNVAPAAGADRIRFVNASWNSNPVNAAINGTQLAANVAYGTASGYASFGATTGTIVFTDAVTGAVLATQANVVLTAFQTLSVYLIGAVGALAVVVVQDY